LIGLPDSFLKQYNEKHSPHTLFGIISSSVSQGASWATALLDWAKRKEITINGASKTATLQMTLLSDTNKGTTYDNTTAFSNTAWTLRFGFTPTTLTTATGTDVINIGVYSEDETSGYTSNAQSGVTFHLQYGASSSVILIAKESAVFDASSAYVVTTSAHVVGKTRYYELTRLDATHARGTVYADSDYTEVIASLVIPITVTTALQYIKVLNYDVQSGVTSKFNADIDSMKRHRSKPSNTNRLSSTYCNYRRC
jgi:hypothetical protein